MARLNVQTLAQLPDSVKKPAYDLKTTGCGIVHIGPGAFHRAHQAVYTDLAMAHGGNWRIQAVSMRSRDLQEKLAEQDNLYALAVLDHQPYTQIVGALKNVFVLATDRAAIMEALGNANTHIITLTITEKGYCLNNQGELDSSHPDIRHDLEFVQEPISAIGLLVAALSQRKKEAHCELTIISCDNLSDNGTKLGAAVKAFANLLDAKLADWIEQNICFPNTMVDSITPATDSELIERTEAEIGVHDAWPIQREAFSQWVVEDKFSGPRPAWDKVGVTFTDDVHVFEKAKLRILNGTHSTLAYIGSLCGLDTVYAAINQPALEQFIRHLLTKEILPTINAGDKLDVSAYADEIIQRYHNPHIRHMLAQIAWDGSQKLPFRILNTIRDRLTAKGSISYLCAPIAAWILFIAQRQQFGEKLTDPKAEKLLALAAEHQDNVTDFADAILNLQEVFAELSDNREFRDTVHVQLATLKKLDKSNPADCLGAL